MKYYECIVTPIVYSLQKMILFSCIIELSDQLIFFFEDFIFSFLIKCTFDPFPVSCIFIVSTRHTRIKLKNFRLHAKGYICPAASGKQNEK